MIDQNLINECEKHIDSYGSLMMCQAIDLIEAYTSLIEQNDDLHKELAAAKKVNQDMHVTVGGYLHGKQWEHWNELNAGKLKL